MCFSASASFTSSAVLALAGIALVCRTKSKRLIPLASIPLFFAVQQAAEGYVWLNHLNAPFAKNFFLFFAYSFWPVWLPFSLWIAENESRKKQFLTFFLGMGIGSSLLSLTLIPQMNPVYYHCSIQYSHSFSLNLLLLALSVLFTTVTPFFFSSINRIRIVAILSVASAILIILIDRAFFTSMWCFFSAWVTLSLFWALPKK